MIVAAWRLRSSQARIRRATDSEYRHPHEAQSIEQHRKAEQHALPSAMKSLQQTVLRPGALKAFSPKLRRAADEVHDRQCRIGACTLNKSIIPAFRKHSHEIEGLVLQHYECSFLLSGITHEITDWRQIVACHRSFGADF